MRAVLLAAVCLFGVALPAAADYERSEKTAYCEVHLKAPEAATDIAPLRDQILALYKTDADQAMADAKDDHDGNPSFHPYQVDITWRITFENDSVLSLSAETFADTDGAHPNGSFRTLVWDKQAGAAVPITALFDPGQQQAALKAIADAAVKAWNRAYMERSGEAPGADSDLATQGIGPEADKLQTYALMHAKGSAAANGILLLYGAGQVWPHVLGDFRLGVPASAFAPYLAERWKAVFSVR